MAVNIKKYYIQEACVTTRYHLPYSELFPYRKYENSQEKKNQYNCLTKLLKESKCFDRQCINLL